MKKYQGLPKVADVVATPPRGPGRPKGAGTSADAVSVTLRLSEDLYRRAQIALLQRQDKRPVSRLVDDLLSEWLKSVNA